MRDHETVPTLARSDADSMDVDQADVNGAGTDTFGVLMLPFRATSRRGRGSRHGHGGIRLRTVQLAKGDNNTASKSNAASRAEGGARGKSHPVPEAVMAEKDKAVPDSARCAALAEEEEEAANAWNRNCSKLEAFHSSNGHCNDYLVVDPELRKWVGRQRMALNNGTLEPEQVARLKKIGFHDNVAAETLDQRAKVRARQRKYDRARRMREALRAKDAARERIRDGTGENSLVPGVGAACRQGGPWAKMSEKEREAAKAKVRAELRRAKSRNVAADTLNQRAKQAARRRAGFAALSEEPKEAARAKKRLRAKKAARMRAHRAALSEEEKEVARAKGRARDRARRAALSEEEKEAARAKKREYDQAGRTSEVRAKNAARMKAHRAALSEEEKEAARAKERARRAALSEEEKEAARAKGREYDRARRTSEAVRAKNAARMRAHRAALSEEKKEAARAKGRARERARRAALSEGERQARRARERGQRGSPRAAPSEGEREPDGTEHEAEQRAAGEPSLASGTVPTEEDGDRGADL